MILYYRLQYDGPKENAYVFVVGYHGMLSFASELLRIFPMFRIPGSATVIAKNLAPNEDEDQALPAYYRRSQNNS